MKKLWMLLICGCLFIPEFAKAEQVGVYVAPKFVLGFSKAKFDISSEAVAPGIIRKNTSSISKSKMLPGGALALGYDFYVPFEVPIRTELELSMFKKFEENENRNDSKGTFKLEQGALLFNVFYDMKNDTDFTPYIGAGVGIAAVKTHGKTTLDKNAFAVNSDPVLDLKSKTQKNVAWMATIGLAYEISESFALDLGYRFASFGKGETEKGSTILTGPTYQGKSIQLSSHVKTKNLYMHQVMLGARITF